LENGRGRLRHYWKNRFTLLLIGYWIGFGWLAYYQGSWEKEGWKGQKNLGRIIGLRPFHF